MEIAMLLATTQVEDFDRFLEIFSTTGAEKRKEHGSKSALIFRDPSEDDRVWVIFDWDEQGWQSFVSDPEVPPIMKEAGHKTKPQARSSPAITTPDTDYSVGRRQQAFGVASPARCSTGHQYARRGDTPAHHALGRMRQRLTLCAWA
jgi:hypothetical protein